MHLSRHYCATECSTFNTCTRRACTHSCVESSVSHVKRLRGTREDVRGAAVARRAAAVLGNRSLSGLLGKSIEVSVGCVVQSDGAHSVHVGIVLVGGFSWSGRRSYKYRLDRYDDADGVVVETN